MLYTIIWLTLFNREFAEVVNLFSVLSFCKK